MAARRGSATIFAALLFPALSFASLVRADDVTLLSREGNVSVSGQLQGFDGEFYRIESKYGPMTIDAQAVICEGPACPELIAPKAVLRIVGGEDAGALVLPKLFERFAAQRGLTWQSQAATAPALWAATVLDPSSHQILAEISFTPMLPEAAAQARASGAAELQLSSTIPAGDTAKAVALDALVPIMAPDNPTPKLDTPGLAKALSGEVKNWAALGGPDMPIVLHALAAETDMAQALASRLGVPLVAEVLHPDMASLAQAVAKDPWALAITGQSHVAPAKLAALYDSCGFPLQAQSIAVKSEDYPLAIPLYLISPPRRLPLMGREFLEFLASPAAEAVVADAGYINRAVETVPMTQDGMRLLNAIRGAGEDVSLADLKRLAEVMEGADRLSLTFRFDEATSELEPSSKDHLAQLARLIAAEHFPAQQLILAGFSDGSGEASANRALSSERARRVVEDLAALAPDLRIAQLPIAEGFGEALPIACDETAIGRKLNRRVELWLVPNFTPEPL